MKNLYLFALVVFFGLTGNAQGNFCSGGGNVILFTNYDGGNLTINVNQNIPNIRIGVVSYEAVSITLTGTYASNVTEVRYAGYNSANTNCSPSVPTTVFNNTGAAATSITFAPASTLPNGNGNGSIICGYSCNVNANQGGCNTVDQIEAYWQSIFSGYSLYYHRVQYGCWSGTESVSSGGDCCALVVPLSVGTVSQPETCAGSCDGVAEVIAGGGETPYTYLWSTGDTSDLVQGLCPGTYYVTVTDNVLETVIDTVVVDSALPILVSQSLELCFGETVTVGTSVYASSGVYVDTLLASAGCDSVVHTTLTVFPENLTNQVFEGSECDGIEVVVNGNIYTQTGIYFDTLHAANGCDSVILTNIQLTEDSLFSQQPSNQTRNEGQTATFKVTSTMPITSFQWQENSGTGFVNLSNAGAYSGTNSDELLVSNVVFGMNNFLYRCIAQYELCEDTSTSAKLTVKRSTGIASLHDGRFKVFPNPAQDILSISSSDQSSVMVSIYDMQGRVLLAPKKWHTDGDFTIDISAFESGLYMLKIDRSIYPLVKQ